MTRIVPTHRATWLCPDAAARERLLDMDERIKRPRALAFGVLGLAVLSSVPFTGVMPLLLLAVAVLGFAIVDRVRQRVETPEYAIVASWVFAQGIIAWAVVMTGGNESHAAAWLAVPIVTLPARFGSRGLAGGVVFTVALLSLVTLGVPSGEPAPAAYTTIYLVAAIIAIALLSTALMRSDLDHRTDSIIDGLTGMLNRRALAQRLDELSAQASISGLPVSLVVSDLDHFKRVNDLHGHATGDAVLVDVAYRLRKELRAFDLAYRLGGEEFLVVLPGADVADGLVIAERLRAAVAAEPAAGVPVTMSFGVSGSHGGEFDHVRVMAAADGALYAAKAAGRDRVEVAAPSDAGADLAKA
jgi:diguanylate cyclase (GGDEF)-like protein